MLAEVLVGILLGLALVVSAVTAGIMALWADDAFRRRLDHRMANMRVALLDSDSAMGWPLHFHLFLPRRWWR